MEELLLELQEENRVLAAEKEDFAEWCEVKEEYETTFSTLNKASKAKIQQLMDHLQKDRGRL